jgi:hypothetical protein
VLVAVALLSAFGPERRDVVFGSEQASAAAAAAQRAS